MEFRGRYAYCCLFSLLTACGVESTSPVSTAESNPAGQTQASQPASGDKEEELSSDRASSLPTADSIEPASNEDNGSLNQPSMADPDSVDALERCAAAGLIWKTGRKTNYVSYPDPGSEECIEYNGCKWAGYFASCNGQQDPEWIAATNIAAVFPLGELAGHQLCIKSGDRLMIVNAIDTCGDDDCNGCCTRNKGTADALIDLESATNARWGLIDGPIQWADLGARQAPICQ